MWELFSQAKDSALPTQVLSILSPWVSKQALEVQTRCVDMLSGASSPSSKVVLRWSSWYCLTSIEWKGPITSHPPLKYLLPLFMSKNSDKVKFGILPNTDYLALAMRTEILGHLLNEIDGYFLTTDASDAFAHNSSDLDLIVHALNDLHPKIRDIPSARLERTRARDTLQRLSMQLYYQADIAKKSKSAQKFTLNRWLSGNRRPGAVA